MRPCGAAACAGVAAGVVAGSGEAITRDAAGGSTLRACGACRRFKVSGRYTCAPLSAERRGGLRSAGSEGIGADRTTMLEPVAPAPKNTHPTSRNAGFGFEACETRRRRCSVAIAGRHRDLPSHPTFVFRRAASLVPRPRKGRGAPRALEDMPRGSSMPIKS